MSKVYNFKVEEAVSDCCSWIWNWFKENGQGCKAVVGISGGKDSTVVAALLVKTLGKERVIGVKIPNGTQEDIQDANDLIDILGIKSYEVNIEQILKGYEDAIYTENDLEATEKAMINLPARVRMSVLYAVAQSVNGRVANTCNMSEDWVGYSTRYGDSVGDFSPLSNFTVTEVIDIGINGLGLPTKLITKAPADGLCGKTDEENLGFSYSDIDKVIRERGNGVDDETLSKIEEKHEKNLFKMKPMPTFSPNVRTLYTISNEAE